MADFTGTEGADIVPTLLIGPVQGLGDDTINGLGGDDLLAGYSGNDVISGGTGADVIIGGILNVVGGIGDIQLSGVDTADYSTSAARVAVLLYETGNLDIDILGINLGLTGVSTGQGGDAEGDSLIGITNLTGSAHNDYLGGNNNENTLVGGAGNDGLAGAAGADVLDGGAGTDMADYLISNAAVNVDLAAGTASGGHAAGDTLTSIENLRGSAFNDTLTGDAGSNRLSGADGADTLDGGAGNDQLVGGAGADVLIGGEGFDSALYDNAAAGVTASLADAAGNTGDAAGDTYSGIEHLVGSAFNDVLTGDAAANYLIGQGGDDTLTGGVGADRLVGGAGADTFVFSAVADSRAKVAFDLITDFSQTDGDHIDVSGITGGSGSFIGSAAFSGDAGEVRFVAGAEQTNVYIDANGDGWADGQIRLTGSITLTADDFVL
ncbi:calcium-binding protein [Inquilinus sp. NPDC058860]|uniref:calcium-binding protein n=1 Tax=Inquilinus sp. NPDC058860 TaxID=3346652 RepID=UPI0036A23EB7